MKEKTQSTMQMCHFVIQSLDILHAGSLNNHVVKVHDEKKQFTCYICIATFVLNYTFNRHVETVHEEKKQFKCDICNASFGLKYPLKIPSSHLNCLFPSWIVAT